MTNQSPPPDSADSDVSEAEFMTDEADAADMVLDEETAVEADVFSEAEALPTVLVPLPPGTLPEVDISGEDMDFIRRVFTQVKDVDFRTPPPPPPKGLSGPDKKMHDLRDKVRRLERELARVGFIWSGKQQQVEALDLIISTKELERATTVQKYRTFKEQATRAVKQARGEAEASKLLVSTLTGKKNELEETLRRDLADHTLQVQDLNDRVAREEQEKAAMLADFRAKMEAAQNAFTLLREQSARTHLDLDAVRQQLAQTEGALTERENELANLRQQTAATEADLNRRITEMEARLSSLNDQLMQSDEKVQSRDRTVTALAEKLTDREKTTAQLAEEMSRARGENEQRMSEMRTMVKTGDDEVARLQRELDQAKAELLVVQDSYEKRGVELERMKQRLATS